MTQNIDLDYFAKRLQQLREHVIETSKQVSSAAQPVQLDQNRVGRLSRMDAMQSQAMAQANALRQQALLVALDVAIARVETGQYGRCLVCDELIACERLQVDPTAEHCIECAAKLEN